MGTQRGPAGLSEPWGGSKAEPVVKISAHSVAKWGQQPPSPGITNGGRGL